MSEIPNNVAQNGQVLRGILPILVAEGWLDDARARQVQAEAQQSRRSIQEILLEREWTQPRRILMAQAISLGLPIVDAMAVNLERAPSSLLKEEVLARLQVLPLRRRGNKLALAHADPTRTQSIDEVRFQTNLAVETVLAVADDLKSAMTRLLDRSNAVNTEFTQGGDVAIDVMETDGKEDEQVSGGEDVSVRAEDPPAVKFVHNAISMAVRRGASDLHFEPYETEIRLRLRLDGVLTTVARAPATLRARIASKIKVMAGLDIAEKRVPQDGRLRIALDGARQMDFRVSTLPTMYGEKIVMRMLDAAAARMGIEKLGYEDHQKQLFLDALARPYGMILVTGPTGSGKTVSLYTGLNILNTEERNISTAEDPVEIRVHGINQVQINEKQGMTFERALRSFLRQDPDVIMVGEIRDGETAAIAVKAAQTGHLVLATLHTNDAPQTVARLAQMGIEPYNIVASVMLVIAQRLARRLHSCKKKVKVAPEVLLAAGFSEAEVAAGIQVFEPAGCQECNGGYKGRVGIYQVMPMVPAIQRALLTGGSAMAIAAAAQAAGIQDLRRSALNRVKDGVIDLHEADRVTVSGAEEEGADPAAPAPVAAPAPAVG